MIQRRQHNRIFSLKDQNGNRVFQHEEMEQELRNHFQNLLTEPTPNRDEAIAKITRHIPSIITREQNLALLREVSLEEVKAAVMHMLRNKALGPDGFTVEFFKATWKFMGQDITDVVEESRRHRKVYPALNATFITLIPKQEHADTPVGFRPLCSVM